MKKILNALFLTLLTVFTFSSCSDVPAPYDILGEGDVPGLTGDGTKENPYNIEAAQQKQDGSIAWVQGYIVGAIENVYDDKGEFAGNKASFTAPFNITSNVLIAESPDETNESKCLPVKIKNGSDLANALNLKDHPENKGGVLLIQGELSAGFGKAALINTTAAVFNNKEIGEEQGGEDLDPDNPLGLDISVAPLADLSNDFNDVQHQADYSKVGWINKAVKGNRIWQGAIYDPQKYLAASTYGVNSGETAEYWFVTPYFTVSADKQFTFKATVNKYSETMSLKVFFLQLKDGKMERHEISVNGIPTTGTYQWTSDLKVDLSTYAGQNGFVGFQYVATRGEEVQTYGIDDILYGEGGGEVPGPEEGTELLTNGGFESWADGYPTGWKSASTASNATLEQSVDKRSGTYSVLVKGASSNKRLGSTEMTLKAGTYVFSAYLKAATTDKASACLGYAPVDETGKVGTYVYDDYVNNITNEDWVTKSFTFTLDAEQTICLVVMNPKSSGKDLLIDDASLMTKDGGLVGGIEEPEPSSEELFISEYVEGSSNNKYIEIYNPAGQTVDLSGYRLDIAANGKEWSYGDAKYDNSMDLSGKTLAPHATLVFKHKQATLYMGEALEANFVNFNGDDAIGLFKNGSLIDIVGEKGSTNKYGENKTLRRKPSVKTPNPVFTLDEWEELEVDEISGLGSHIME